MLDTKTIMLLSPIILIQIILMVINLINLSKKTQTKFLNKIIWLLIIVLGSLIGNIIYLVIESEKNERD